MIRLDVYFNLQQVVSADVHGRVIAVIDVLRASTTIATALANGARSVIPIESSEEVALRSKGFERGAVLLAGERRLHTIEGFDLGNSPLEYTREVVEGKTILFTTTNGTAAILGIAGARDVVIASYVNFSPVAAMLRAAARSGTDLSILCAGRDRKFSLEDAACAGRFVRSITKRLANVGVNDAARACALLDRKYGDNIGQLFADAEHGQALAEAGFAEDLTACARIDAHPVVPVWHERQITRLGFDRER